MSLLGNKGQLGCNILWLCLVIANGAQVYPWLRDWLKGRQHSEDPFFDFMLGKE